MSARASSRPSLVLGLALGGVLLGHTVAYRLLLPDAHARTIELAATGHGYLSGANAVGLVAAMVALAALFLGRVLRTTSVGPWHLTTRLMGFQMAAFVAMEVLERVSSGAGLQHLPAALLVGLPVQAAIALLVAMVARLLLRVAATIAERLGAAPTWAVAPVTTADGSAAPRQRLRTGSPPGRAPPSFVVA
jgi:hypothetical protein